VSLYLKQWLGGQDFARADRFASQMANFVYVIGDDQSRECMVVDPAWDVAGLVERIDAEDLKLTGALITHYHPDHIGGEIFGYKIAGLAELMSIRPVRVHVNSNEADGVKMVTGIEESDLARHSGGDRVAVGDIEVTLLHTPGHTPGSQCFLVEGALVSGDTLFIGGCGRVDLPGGDPDQMYYSLTKVLGQLPEPTLVYPGHDYGVTQVSTIGDEKRENRSLQVGSLEDWRRLMGAT